MEFLMPKLGLTMTEGTVVRWLRAAGDRVDKGDPLLELEMDKATMQIDAPYSGTLEQILIAEGATVPCGTVLATIATAADEAPAAVRPGAGHAAGLPAPIASASAAPAPTPPAGPDQARVNATPVARRLAKEAGLDIGAIAGTGPLGRVTKEDVERAMADRAAAATVSAVPPPAPAVAGAALPPPAPAPSSAAGMLAVAPDVDVRPMSATRSTIARHMAASALSTAAVTLTSQADATELVRLRDALSREWQATEGFVPSFNDLFLAIVARALRDHPYMNARVYEREIHCVSSINLGLAVETDRGLLVPVLRDVQDRTLAGIGRATRALIDRAHAGTLSPDDLAGGTFTLTNLGMFDVDAFTPIINAPECAILGVGRIHPAAAVLNGQLAIRQSVTLSLTFDHRAVDGAPAARFLEHVGRLVAQPCGALVR